MLKVQFGSGGNKLDGWINHDIDVDITKPLPYENSSVDYIFFEHLLEHVDHCQGLHFLDECYRILKPGGRIRITVPCVDKVWRGTIDRDAYCKYIFEKGFSRSTGSRDASRALIECHGHKSIFDENGRIIRSMLAASGFCLITQAGNTTSFDPELSGINGHWRECGPEFFELESITVEAQK